MSKTILIDTELYTLSYVDSIIRFSGCQCFKEMPNIKSSNGIKNLYLVQKGWNFIKSEDLLAKAKYYIDNHNDNLLKKFELYSSQKT